MEEKIRRTKKEQRAESDARLLESAIRLFGENGYENTTLTQIAKGAGLTSGLIVQRYKTKENLLFEAWKKVVSESLTDINEFDTFPNGFLNMIDDHRELYKNNYEYFRFLKMLLDRTTLPESFLQKNNDFIKNSNANLAIMKAQKEKEIAEVESNELIKAFVSQLINQIEVSEKYGVEFPEYDFFFKILRLTDTNTRNLTERRDKIVKSYFEGFDAICHVSVKENTVEEVKVPKQIEELINPKDAISSFRTIVEHTVHEDDRQKLIEFYDFSAFNEIFRNRRMIHISVKNISGKGRVYIFSVDKRDSNGDVLELLMTIHDNE